MDYTRVRHFLNTTQQDILYGNKNYKTQSYLYYFMDDHIHYEAFIKFKNPVIRAFVWPFLDANLRKTLFFFHMELKMYPLFMICKVKSHTPDLVDATLIIQNRPEGFLIIIQEMKFIYQNKTPQMIVDTVSTLVKTMIHADIQHFLKQMEIAGEASIVSEPASASCPLDNKTHISHTPSCSPLLPPAP